MWKEHCGKDEFGYKAWEKLITMSNLERDAQQSIKLAEAEKAHTCAVNPEQAGKAGSIINPTIQEAGFLRAREQFEKACEAKLGQKCMNPDAPEKREHVAQGRRALRVRARAPLPVATRRPRPR